MALIREIGKNGRGFQCMVEVSLKKEGRAYMTFSNERIIWHEFLYWLAFFFKWRGAPLLLSMPLRGYIYWFWTGRCMYTQSETRW